ncbi:MAG TPA: phosphate ABC transporter permease PstA [Candidatus Limnocylindria bacterium]|nr:phosphate ABC transporter permease PstA [Candidatus Limnocylindria bacterium]
MSAISAQTYNGVDVSVPARRGRRAGSIILRALCWLSGAATMGVLVLIVGYILVNGVPHLKPSLFEWKYTSRNVSMLHAILNTLTMTGLALLFSVPVGVFGGIYLAEYAKRGSRLVRLIRVTAETLAGIPSIIYALFGMMAFVIALRMGNSILAGALTLAVMTLPLILRQTEESLLAVPLSYREGSFGLGAGRLRTTVRIALPVAMPGILAAVILSIGRISGETAALIFTSGTAHRVAGLSDSGRTLAVHLFQLQQEGRYVNEAFAVAVVLLAVVALMNALSAFVAKKLTMKG